MAGHPPTQPEASSRRLSPLAGEIASAIVTMLRDGRLMPGAHLRELALSEQFQVSRSPVREALTALTRMGVLVHLPHRGVFVHESLSDATLDGVERDLSQSTEEAHYLDIGAQYLGGALPEQFTEADLGRRFRLSRAEVSRIVARMAREGWIERRPGYGWAFVPVLTTPEAFALSYRFRLTIEPAALLEPTFAIDRDAFATCRAQQIALVEGRIRSLSAAELFTFGSTFHEMLVRCSGNPFFLDALQRINRQRRLLEYRAMIRTEQFLDQAREHLEILRLLERGRHEAAANLLRRHLDVVREVKLNVLSGASIERRRPSTHSQSRLVAHVHF